MHASSLTIGWCFAALFVNRHYEVKFVFFASNSFLTLLFLHCAAFNAAAEITSVQTFCGGCRIRIWGLFRR